MFMPNKPGSPDKFVENSGLEIVPLEEHHLYQVESLVDEMVQKRGSNTLKELRKSNIMTDIRNSIGNVSRYSVALEGTRVVGFAGFTDTLDESVKPFQKPEHKGKTAEVAYMYISSSHQHPEELIAKDLLTRVLRIASTKGYTEMLVVAGFNDLDMPFYNAMKQLSGGGYVGNVTYRSSAEARVWSKRLGN